MRTVYIADDGKEFDDEQECQDYEFVSNLSSIHMYDEDGNELKDLLSDDIYYEVRKIVINTEEELCDLHRIADYTGFCGYKKVTSAGVWIYDEDGECFVRYPDRAFFNNLKQISCHVDANEDGTFCVVNTYKDDNGKNVEQKYQRVKIDIFHGIQMFKTISPLPRINNIEVLENEKGELFTIKINERKW